MHRSAPCHMYRFDELSVALAEGDAFDDHASGWGAFEYVALQRPSDRLRERRGPTTA